MKLFLFLLFVFVAALVVSVWAKSGPLIHNRGVGALAYMFVVLESAVNAVAATLAAAALFLLGLEIRRRIGR